jgi:glycosyltransferase involved in cell wall biosynthesis/Tfp pilus assembly protein PilF
MPADRVVVIPNGVDTALYAPGAPRLPLSTRKRFKFLFVGGTIHRKGIDILLEAYVSAFKRSDSVCLVIKDMGTSSFYRDVHAKEMIDAVRSRPDAPEIEYIDRTLSPEEMAGLYGACDCLVQPYRGEGFGLPIAEAMACGLPVVVTGAGAALDFCSEETATLIPARLVRLGEKRIGDMDTVDYPFLAEPDRTALVRILREVRKDKKGVARKAAAARERIVRDFGWAGACAKVAERVRALRERPIVRESGDAFTTTPPATGGNGIHREGMMHKVLERAREHAMRGNPEAGIALFESAEREHTQTGTTLAHARFLLENHAYSRLSALLEQIPLEIRKSVEWLEVDGWCREGLGNMPEAEQCADAVLSRDPRSVDGLTLKGKIAAAAGRTEEAQRFLRGALAVDPRAAVPRALLGAMLCSTGDQEAGVDLLEEAFTADPLNGDILVSFVDASRALGRTARLEEALRRSAQHYPASKRLQYFLAEVLAQNGNWNDALLTILSALAEFGVDDEALAFALKARVETGNPTPAAVPPLLSVCMIVKNEEQHLPRALWSVLPLTDEIVVVDTGSDDRSEEIAAAFGAKVFQQEWAEDFAAARNASIEQATGRWIFVLDGDEVIATEDHAKFRALLAGVSPEPTAYSFTTRNYVVPMDIIGWVANDGQSRAEAGTGWIPSPKVRLFPRRDGARFEFPVHELVDPSLQRCGVRILQSDIPVHHYGKLDLAKTKVKAQRYLELGRKKLQEKGAHDLSALMELAFQENDLGNFEESLALYRRVVTVNNNIPRAHFGMGAALAALRRYDEAIGPLQRAVALDRSLKEAYVQLALAHLRLERVSEALKAGEALHAVAGDYPPGEALLAALRFCANDRAGGEEVLSRLRSRQVRYMDYFRELGKHLLAEEKPHLAVRLLEPFAHDPAIAEDLALVLVDAYRAMAIAAAGTPAAPVLPEP